MLVKYSMAISFLFVLSARCVAQHLPDPSGPFKTGSRIVELTDLSRKEKIIVDRTASREVKMRIWYPTAVSEGKKAVYFPEASAIVNEFTNKGLVLPTSLGRDLAYAQEISTVAVENAAILTSAKEKFPLIIYSSGGGVSPNSYSALGQEFASRGYIVVILSHAFSSLDYFSSSGLSLPSPYWSKLNDPDTLVSKKVEDQLSDEMADDANFVIVNLQQGQTDPFKAFAAQIDFDKVVIAGHSRGGKTVARACSKYKIFKAGIVYDNLAPATERISGVNQPLLFIRTNWAPDRTSDLMSYIDKNKSFVVDAMYDKAAHFNFTDYSLLNYSAYPSAIDAMECFRVTNEILKDFLSAVFNKTPFPVEDDSKKYPEVKLQLYKK
jgi:dienelactone hydrolase